MRHIDLHFKDHIHGCMDLHGKRVSKCERISIYGWTVPLRKQRNSSLMFLSFQCNFQKNYTSCKIFNKVIILKKKKKKNTMYYLGPNNMLENKNVPL